MVGLHTVRTVSGLFCSASLPISGNLFSKLSLDVALRWCRLPVHAGAPSHMPPPSSGAVAQGEAPQRSIIIMHQRVKVKFCPPGMGALVKGGCSP